jgi:predicted NodU family carbamoyl transferase
MRYFGIYWFAEQPIFQGRLVCHDTGICILDQEGKLEFFGSMERYDRIKKSSGFPGTIKKFWGNMPVPQKGDIVSFVRCNPGENVPYQSAPFWGQLSNINWSKFNYMEPSLINGVVVQCVGHHAAHAAASWMFRPNNETRQFFAYDGGGNQQNGTLNFSLKGRIGQNLYSEDKFDTIPSSLPLIMSSQGIIVREAGKLMGMAGYFPEIPMSEICPCDGNSLPSRAIMKMCAGYYRKYTEIIWKAIKSQLDGGGVVIGGGTALALEINSKIHAVAKDVVFGPPTDDSGIAIGCAALAFFQHVGQWPNAFQSPSLMVVPEGLQQQGPQSPGEIAKLLASEQVVGLLRGNAEAGPRALGHRSLLASPQTKEMLHHVSVELKKREFYRPLAPMVTDRQFDRLFVGPKGKYMQYMCSCTEECAKLCPAIVHKDNSSRPQVVDESDPWLYELLEEFGKLTGVECLINTSLNGPGMPICHTLKDAQDDFGDTKVVLCSIP